MRWTCCWAVPADSLRADAARGRGGDARRRPQVPPPPSPPLPLAVTALADAPLSRLFVARSVNLYQSLSCYVKPIQ